MNRHFCTYFDHRYLSRGLALHQSLREHCPEFTLWILCFDSIALEVLKEMALEEVRPISLEEFLHEDDALLAARADRSLLEFYFTCTPSLPLFVLDKHPEVGMITYLDADLFFFGSPEPLFEEMGSRSIAVTPHRFPPDLKDYDRFGLYNVGWLSFNRDAVALECLNWWRDRCLEWCYDREEDGKFADQKYLDQWPALFQSVAVLENPGANLAAWNLSGTKLLHHGVTTVNSAPLVFFHFHALKIIHPHIYEIAFKPYNVKPSRVLRRHVVTPYLRCLRRIDNQINTLNPMLTGTQIIRFGVAIPKAKEPWWKRTIRRIRYYAGIAKGIITRKYFLYLARRLLLFPCIGPNLPLNLPPIF